MEFSELLCGPQWGHLDRVITGADPVLVSGFFGGGMLARIGADAADGAKLLVRLPRRGAVPPQLANDPRPLLALARRRRDFQLFVDPAIHAKVYASSAGAILGSANLSDRGFSGQAEAAIFTSDPATVTALRTSAEGFIALAERATIRDLEVLVAALEARRTRIRPPPEELTTVDDASGAGQAGNPPFESFLAWLNLRVEPEALVIKQFATGRNAMNGHVYTGYHGLTVMFRSDPAWARSFLRRDWMEPAVEIGLRRIGDFVRAHPGSICGKRTAVWEASYLPTTLGGRIEGGGGSYGVLRRMMTLIPKYLRHVGLI